MNYINYTEGAYGDSAFTLLSRLFCAKRNAKPGKSGINSLIQQEKPTPGDELLFAM